MGFTILFLIECALKILERGFIIHKNSYLRDPWNWLDFAIVIIAIFDFLPQFEGSSFKAVRTFRVLRPLRSIKAVPSMKVLIGALLKSIPALGNVIVFLLFISLLFAILGV